MASIQKRPDGTWRARYRDEAGKEHAKHFKYRDKASRGAKNRVAGDSAQEWLDSVTTAVVTGTYVDPATGKTTLASFYAEWSLRQVWADGTYVAMNLAIAKCTFKDVEFSKLKRSHVEAWVKSMAATLAPGTVRTRVNNVRAALRAAVRDRLLPVDPSEGVTLPRRRKADQAMTIPTPDEVAKVLEAADDWFKPFVALCAFAGLRLGEAAGVQLTDVEFLHFRLNVQRQIQRAEPGSVSITPPKYGSERQVFIPEQLTAMLSKHVQDFGVRGDEQWLFVGEHGLPPHANTIHYWWTKTVKNSGVGAMKLHNLRHFFASGLIAAGCDVVTVQRAMGHARATTTLNTYSHLWPTAEDRTRAASADMMRTVLEAPADSLRTKAAKTL